VEALSMPYLVDGNNLAHALGLSRGSDADREACAGLVADFCRSRGARATIVFDGPPPQGPAAREATSRTRIVFSASRPADDTILKMIRASGTPRDFTLITSDKSLGDKARHLGAQVERAHEFSRRLDAPKPRRRETAAKPRAKESPEEIAAWLAVFDPGRK
jgi:predicted RNA-binding protein with PIN domain